MNVLALVAIAVAFLSLGAVRFLWRLHAKTHIGLSRFLAVTGTLSAAAAIWLGIVSLALLAAREDVVAALGPGTILALLVLDVVPLANAAFLRWLRSRGARS